MEIALLIVVLASVPGKVREWFWRGVWIWITCGASLQGGTLQEKTPSQSTAAFHWAFQPLRKPEVPRSLVGFASPIDAFVQRQLEGSGLSIGRESDRATLVRRISLVLTGLPPGPEELQAVLEDPRPDALTRWVERCLASPAYGPRWAQHWLDAAGYADSNGYFNADTDRPLAYRYRDYVIRSIQRDKPFDQFVREQLAGDELSGWSPGSPATPDVVELLEATHFLRNGQDGTGESDGNPDEVRVDRYYALEGSIQILGSSLLGMTVQCAKCHDHKFEPFSQKDYYALQAFLYPAFPIEHWVKPNDKVVEAALPGQAESWKASEDRLSQSESEERSRFNAWVLAHRPLGKVLFVDRFEESSKLTENWSNTAPGDDHPAGLPPVVLQGTQAPSARVNQGVLHLIEGGGSGDRWLSTRTSFSWQPPGMGDWIQATFDLVATHAEGQVGSAERIGYIIAAHDFDDSSRIAGGNLLVDGNPGGPTSVHVDYPGSDSKSLGSIGTQGYKAGHNYGVRITRTGPHAFSLQHWVDGSEDGKPISLTADDLPPGGFAFEYCCGRSFQVDNVVVESSQNGNETWEKREQAYQTELAIQKKHLDRTLRDIQSQRTPKTWRVAWVSDVAPTATEVPLLKRGNPKTPGEAVAPQFPGFLKTGTVYPVSLPPTSGRTTGRRLALAKWFTAPGSPQAALLARVTVNRVWLQCWGEPLVETPDNLGLSGSPPKNPPLLEWLAADFVESGWSLKHLQRRILSSQTFRQSSRSEASGWVRDPENRNFWRYPVHRLDAESLRDTMLAVSGYLGSKHSGPYVPTPRNKDGEIAEDDSPEGAARSIFLQHRRTQVPTLLAHFDAPSLVFNCTRRAQTTMPLQSLSLLNSEFVLQRGKDLARRLEREGGDSVDARIRLAFVLTCGRPPDPMEHEASKSFLNLQQAAYGGVPDSVQRAWNDFAQSMFALNDFLYIQ